MVGANRIISIDIVIKDKNSFHVLNISFGRIVQNIQIFITNKKNLLILVNTKVTMISKVPIPRLSNKFHTLSLFVRNDLPQNF